MRPLITITAVIALVVLTAPAETISCDNSLVTVTVFNATTAELICTATTRAETLFAACNVPPLAAPVKIDVVTELIPGAAALFHRDGRWIEVLEPSLMEAGRGSNDAFAFLLPEAYFQSVIVHELTHAAIVDLPCPFDGCVVAQEFLGHAMQVMSLTEQQKLAFADNSNFDRQISRDELSAVILYIAPFLFTQKTWAHLLQRDDPCGYIGLITSGAILLDRERF